MTLATGRAMDNHIRLRLRLRLLVIGTGSIGQRHVRCFQRTKRVEIAICDSNAALNKQIADEYAVSSFASLDVALAEPWDAAVVATPANTHISIAQQLARNGIHVLVEKPLSTQLEGIDELCSSAQRSGSKLSVAYVLRGHPVVERLKAMIESGEIGAPVQAQFIGGQNFPTYRPAYRETYYAKHRSGGGAIQDALTHLIDISQWLLGPIDALACDAQHMLLHGVDVEDTVHLLARHSRMNRQYASSGNSMVQTRTMSMFSLNQHQAPNETTITVIGEKGTIRAELHSMIVRSMSRPDSDWQVEHFPPIERDSLFEKQANRFLDFIEARAANQCSISEARAALLVSLTALERSRDSLIELTGDGKKTS